MTKNVPVVITAFLLLAQHPVTAQDRDPASNMLVIQADFAGLVMTGVAKTVSNDLEVFNVRPLIPLYDIRAASQSLAYNAQTWPAGTVFVSVVDPGVGTARKSVVLKTRNNLFFVSPDNGSLSGPAKAYGIDAVREIDETVNRIPGSEWSHTFHGRDVYSYTGARLAAGVISFAEVGPLLDATVIELPTMGARLEYGVMYGQITGGTGRLGNIAFSIGRQLFGEINASYGDRFDVIIRKAGEQIWRGTVPYVKSFGDVPVGENLLFINSSGDTSIAINQGNFAEANGIGAGIDWTIEISMSAN